MTIFFGVLLSKERYKMETNQLILLIITEFSVQT